MEYKSLAACMKERKLKMAMVYVTLAVEIEVDEESLHEYEDDETAWAINNISVSADEGNHLSYWVDYAETDMI